MSMVLSFENLQYERFVVLSSQSHQHSNNDCSGSSSSVEITILLLAQSVRAAVTDLFLLQSCDLQDILCGGVANRSAVYLLD